jgi:hypothetical protein
MTDNTTPDLEQLLTQYLDGVDNPSSDPKWLEARSVLEDNSATLSEAQRTQLEKADRTLASKSAQVSSQIDLAALRAGRPTSHWWWYLDTVGSAQRYLAPRPPSQNEKIFNWVLNGVLVVALIGAAYVAGRNLGIIPTPAPTIRPSATVAPSATLNPDAFDITKGTPVTSSFNEFSMPLPPGWINMSAGTPNQYNFAYGDAQASRAQIRVFVIERSEVATLLDLQQSVSTTEEAMNAYKGNLTPDQYPEIGEVTPSNIGKNQGFAIAYTAPPNPQSGAMDATKIELRLADIPETTKTIALVYFSEAALYEQIKGVINDMINAMEFNPQNVPTPTPLPPTATLHPLQMTPTSTATPSATGGTPAGTAEATAAATAEATSAATAEVTTAPPAATTEATEAPTEEATPAS